jgi:hypothetical protein
VNKIEKAWIVGLVIFVAMAPYFSVAHAIQMPINIVSARWVTSDVTYETGRFWTEIDAAPGDSNIRLRVTIQNLGNATISGITTELRLQYPFTNATGGNINRAYYTGSVSPGASADLEFFMNIDIRAASREYRLSMVVNYLELAVGVGKTLYFLKSVEVTVPVVVSSTRYIVIYNVILSPSTTVPAGNITISGSILNIGKVSTFNTNVTVFSSVLLRPASIIVGQVDPNVPRPFSSGLQLRRDIAPGSYSMTISVTHADIMMIGHVSQFDMRLTIRPPEPRPPPVVEKQGGILAILIEVLRDLLRVLFGVAQLVSALR